MSKASFEEAFDRLKQEYIENSDDSLNHIDQLIKQLQDGNGDWNETFLDLQRAVHTIKGSAGSYGFPTVSIIAHALEDYIETATDIRERELTDIQFHVDRMRAILESGANPDDDAAQKILHDLPICKAISLKVSPQDVQNITAVLIMPKNVQRKIIATELVSCGFRTIMAENGLTGIAAVLARRPDFIVANRELDDIGGLELAGVFDVIEAVKGTNFMLISSTPATEAEIQALPDTVRVVQKGTTFSSDMTNALIEWGIFGKV